MSFGNRNLGQKPKRFIPVDQNPDPVPSPSGGSGLSAGFMILVIALFVVSFSGFWAFSHFANGPKAVRDPKIAALFAAEPVLKARSYSTEGSLPFRMPGNTSMRIAVNRTETGFDAIDSELHEHCTKKVSMDAASWAEKRGKVIFTLEEGAAFLACSMRHQVSRFCKPTYRKRLAHRIEEYLRAHKATAVMMKRASGFVQKTLAIKRLTDEAETGGIVAGGRSAQVITGELGRELKKLSAMGLIGTSDFGNWLKKAPEMLLPYLDDKSSPC